MGMPSSSPINTVLLLGAPDDEAVDLSSFQLTTRTSSGRSTCSPLSNSKSWYECDEPKGIGVSIERISGNPVQTPFKMVEIAAYTQVAVQQYYSRVTQTGGPDENAARVIQN
jgi:hypothetical protein